MKYIKWLEKLRLIFFDKISSRKVKLSDGNILLLRNATIDGERLKLGQDIYIGPNATILCAMDDVVIEDHVVIGPNVTIVESNHVFNNKYRYLKHSGLTGGGVPY